MSRRTIMLAAILGLASAAQAAVNGQDWTGGGEDTLYSNSANWQGGRATDSTAAVRFDTQGGKTVTFDGNYATADYLWVGSTTAGNYATRADDGTWTVNPVVWTSTDDSYGLSGTGSSANLVIADASNQNGALKIEKGTYTWAYTMNIGSKSGLAYFEMAGGSLSVGAQFNPGIGGATSYFKQTGGTINIGTSSTAWSYWGADAGTKSRIDISGGVFNAKNSVSFINGNNARLELNVNGGTMNFLADPYFGEKNGSGSTNIVTISNGGVLNVGSETAAKWMRINSAGTAANEFYLNAGGTLGVAHIEKVSTAEGSKIVFDGGTLKSLYVDSNYNKYIIENDDTLSVEVTELGGIIDVNGHAVNLPKAITGTGTLTITNSSATAGSIAFSANVEGKVRLAASNVTATFADGVTIGGLELGSGWSGTLPSAPVTSYTLDGGAVTMAYGALAGSGTNLVVKAGSITLDMSAATEVEVGTTTAALANVSLADGVALSAITINTSGTAYNWTASLGDDGVITMTAASAKEGTNKWVGPTNGGNWSDNANWDFGIPTADQTVEFDYDVNVILDGATGSDKTVSNVVLNADVQLSYGTGYLSLYFDEINGAHKISLYRTGLKARNKSVARPSTISADTTVEILPYSTDSWIEGTGYSDQPLYIYGKITGSGYVIFRNYIYFYGDNSGHTGKVVSSSNDSRYFMSAESGFSNSSSVSISGSSYFGFTEGTIKFNNLTYSKYGGYRGLNVLNGSAITMELTGTSYLNDNVSFFENKNTDGTWGNSWNNGCATCTIKNSGTLTTTTQYAYTLDCAADSYTTINADNISAAIAVADGATLSGGATIAAPTFAGSAVIAQAASWDTTSETTGEGEETVTTVTTNGLKSASLTIDGAVDISKLTFKVTNPEILPAATKGLTTDWTLPELLAATSITGAAKAETTTWAVDGVERSGYQNTGSQAHYGWLAVLRASGVYFDVKNAKPGFTFTIR